MEIFLDLGTTKVAGIAAHWSERKERSVSAFAEVSCKGLQKGVVTDLESVSSAIDDVVRRLSAATGATVRSVTVNANGAHIESVNAQGCVPIYPQTRAITREDVLQVVNHSRQILSAPDQDQIQAIPREFRVDSVGGVMKPIGLTGGRLEVITHVVSGTQSHLLNIEKAVQMAGLKVEQMVAQPVASGLGCVPPDQREIGTVAVDLGAGTTNISIFQCGSIAFSVVIPVGSNAITSDLSKLLKTSIEEAERLKISAGSALARNGEGKGAVEVLQIGMPKARMLERRVLNEIIESRAREIAILVKQQIDRSGLSDLLPGGVVLTGGGSQLAGIQELFAGVLLHLPVRLGRPHMVGTASHDVNRPKTSALAGLAEFAMVQDETVIEPAGSPENWKHRIRSLKTLFGART